MIWQDLSHPEFNDIARSTPVLLPVSAVEQHGPHLPVATDRMIAEYFSRQVSDRLGSSVLVLPTVAVGCSEHHMDFPGSLTVSHDTFFSVCQQYLQSARRHGFRNFVILNSHGGNRGVLQIFLEKFGADHPDCQIAAVSWWRMVSDALYELSETGPGGVGHACELETSLIMHFSPESVRMNAIEPRANNTPTYDWAEEDLLRPSRVSLYRSMKQITPNGAWGDPTKATPEKGKQIADVVCDSLCTVVQDLAKQ